MLVRLQKVEAFETRLSNMEEINRKNDFPASFKTLLDSNLSNQIKNLEVALTNKLKVIEDLKTQNQLTVFKESVTTKLNVLDQLKAAYDKTVPTLDNYVRNSLKNEIATERTNYVTQQRKAIEDGLKQEINKKTT